VTGRVYCSPAPTPLHITWSIRTSVGGPVLTVYLGAAETGKFIEFADASSLGAAIDELVAAAADYDVALETHAAPLPASLPLPAREPGAALLDAAALPDWERELLEREALRDPDCVAGKHGSCVGGPCRCGCHEPVYAVPAGPEARWVTRNSGPDYLIPDPDPLAEYQAASNELHYAEQAASVEMTACPHCGVLVAAGDLPRHVCAEPLPAGRTVYPALAPEALAADKDAETLVQRWGAPPLTPDEDPSPVTSPLPPDQEDDTP